MDLIDREQLMNYIRSRKINIGKLAHDVIMKQPNIQKQEPCEDAISREEVLKQLRACLTGGEAEYQYVKLHIDSIPSVKPQEPILDKIKAEIEQMDFDFGDFYDHTSTIREMVLEVIDKYRGEE